MSNEIDISHLRIQLAPLSPDDINKILEGLGYLPHRHSVLLIESIKAQGERVIGAYVAEISKAKSAADAPNEGDASLATADVGVPPTDTALQ